MSTRQRNIRMTDEEYESAMKHAEKRGMNFSAFVKQAIDHYVANPPGAPKPQAPVFGTTAPRTEFRPVPKPGKK